MKPDKLTSLMVKAYHRIGEKAVERMCDQLIEKMGGSVVRFSQARATNQTLGIPDRRYRIFGYAFWFEVKAEDGKLSREQFAFLEAENFAGAAAACGGLAELQRCIKSARYNRSVGAHEGIEADTLIILSEWQHRGFRGEKKTRTVPVLPSLSPEK